MRRSMMLLAVLAMVVGFVPGAQAQSVDEGCSFGGTLFPGEEQTKRCTVENNSSVDGGFYWFIPQETIAVYDENGDLVTDGRADTYVSFFSVSLATQRVFTLDVPGVDERDDQDLLEHPADVRETCSEMPLTALDGPRGSVETSCEIGRVRRADYPGLQSFDTRDVEITLHFADQGDQTEFAGWGLGFSETYWASVQPAGECPCGPVYER